ncbi:MAG: hypothetical protein Q7R32_13710 [Dehalococcoidia bacterium]|nr:hypothetical protein [Dehalococcoidia bacterium]
MYVVGTAGHVDHGKSAGLFLHRALKYAAWDFGVEAAGFSPR